MNGTAIQRLPARAFPAGSRIAPPSPPNQRALPIKSPRSVPNRTLCGRIVVCPRTVFDGTGRESSRAKTFAEMMPIVPLGRAARTWRRIMGRAFIFLRPRYHSGLELLRSAWLSRAPCDKLDSESTRVSVPIFDFRTPHRVAASLNLVANTCVYIKYSFTGGVFTVG